MGERKANAELNSDLIKCQRQRVGVTPADILLKGGEGEQLMGSLWLKRGQFEWEEGGGQTRGEGSGEGWI